MRRAFATVLLGLTAFIPSRVSAEPPPVSAGYTIPLIDLAADTKRQVIVDREPGQYLGHPTTVLLEDGKTILCVYPKGHGKGAIVLKRSTDGGRTWSDRLPTPENWSTSKETPTIHRVVGPDGKRRLLLFSGLYPIRMSHSEDDGQTWTPLEPIGEFGGIVAMASLERLKNGDLMALFHDDGRYLHAGGKAGPFVVYKTLSHDGGLTWAAPEAIARHKSAHLCEPGMVRSPDGKRLAVLLRENSQKMNTFLIVSDDEGQTWSEPKELPGALTGDRHVGKYAPDGRLFLSFRDTTRESPTKGDWVAWVGTFEDIVNGREGQYRVRLMKNHDRIDCAYPGVEVLADGTFVVTTYGHWVKGEPPFIVSVRLKLDDLDALARSKSKRPAPADDGADARDRAEFQKAYRLDAGEDLKLVPIPRPKGMAAWMKKENPYGVNRLDDVTALTFRWREPDKLDQETAHYGSVNGWPLRDIPRYLEMGVYEFEIEGDRDLLKTPVPGDWVYRESASPEKKAHALEAILRKAVDPKVAVEFRLLERNVVVVRGEYRYTPIGKRTNHQIEIYGKEIVKNGGGGGGGKFPEFLKWVGSWIETPVVSEVENPPEMDLQWSYNGRNRATAKERQEDHDEALVLKHLQEQTGLSYSLENRDIRVLVIEKAK